MDYQQMIENIACIGKFWREMFNDFDDASIDFPINKTQFKVLYFIKFYPNKTMGEISRITGLEKGSFTTLINHLIKIGLVSRNPSDTDRRVVYLSLTLEGSILVNKIAKSRDEYLDRKFSGLSAAEKNEFLSSIDNAVSILNKIENRETFPYKTLNAADKHFFEAYFNGLFR